MHPSTPLRPAAARARSAAVPRPAQVSPEPQWRRITAHVRDELKRPGSIPSEVVLHALARAWALGRGEPRPTGRKNSPSR